MKLALNAPIHTRAVMVRQGVAPWQLDGYWDPDAKRTVYPMDDPEVRADIRAFLAALWNACLQAEADQTNGTWRSAEGAVYSAPGAPSAEEAIRGS